VDQILCIEGSFGCGIVREVFIELFVLLESLQKPQGACVGVHREAARAKRRQRRRLVEDFWVVGEGWPVSTWLPGFCEEGGLVHAALHVDLSEPIARRFQVEQTKTSSSDSVPPNKPGAVVKTLMG